MNWDSLLTWLWGVANEPATITFLAGLLLMALNWLWAKKPAWEKYRGIFIRGIKVAEAEIPDDTENRALRRFDRALQYIISVIEAAEQRKVKPQEAAQIADGIDRVHAELEASGNIPGAAK